jgi:putative membrane protein
MRPLRALIAIVCLALGVVLGVLNAEPATVDLGAFEVRAGLGVILLCTLLAGVLLGGLAIVASVVLPLRRELRRTRAPAVTAESGPGPAAPSLPIPASSEP